MNRVAVHYLSECTKTWDRSCSDGKEYEKAVEEILSHKHYTIRRYRITHPSGKEEFFDLQGTPGDGSYYKRREEITVSEDQGMSYKDALEYMTCNPSTPLYDDQGNKYLITCCELRINGAPKGDPFCQLRFKNTKFFKTNPKIVYIPFWDAVKEMVSNGRIIGRFADGQLIDSYKNTFDGVVYWSTMGKHHWKIIPSFLSEWNSSGVKWAIVEDPSHSN